MGHKQDFWEWIRGNVWPIFDWFFDLFGVGTTGTLPPDEYVGTIPVGVERFEKSLHAMGVVRNAPAKYKNTVDDRNSIGSWRATHRTHPDFVDQGMQLHITLFPPAGGSASSDEAVTVYAHYEKNYGNDPGGHLDGEDYSAELGVGKATKLIQKHTNYDIHQQEIYK